MDANEVLGELASRLLTNLQQRELTLNILSDEERVRGFYQTQEGIKIYKHLLNSLVKQLEEEKKLLHEALNYSDDN